MKRYPYFPPKQLMYGFAPPEPLSVTIPLNCRFDEVDVLGMVWHGRYASYFEDARMSLGEKYGIDYIAFHDAGVIVPIKQMHVDYMAPLAFKERFHVTASLVWSEAARMNIVYRIRDMQGNVKTTGYTVQLFMLTNNKLCMTKPDFYAAFCERWKNGKLA
ncbi:thioesterase [Deltaproteobacteria bacterium]|nr:thioesterase [Deltaproteobacteria bacterium]